MIYTGTSYKKAIDPVARRALQIYSGQKQRCQNPKNPSYTHYGLRGIKVEYTWRELAGWYIEQTGNRLLYGMHVGRIDHSKNYAIDNIQLQTIKENVLERNARVGNPAYNKCRKVLMIDVNTGSVLKQFESIMAAERGTSHYHGDIRRYCLGELNKTLGGYTFRFA